MRYVENMRVGIFLSELVRVMKGKYIDELSDSEIKDSIDKSVKIMKHHGLNCGEFSIGSIDKLEKVARVTSSISNFDFLLHEIGQYSATKLSLASSEERKKIVEGLKTTIDYASDGNIRVLTIHPATYNPEKPGYAYSEVLSSYLRVKEAWEVSINLLKHISNYARKRNITLGLENMPSAALYKGEILKCPHFGITRNEFFKIISEVNNPALKVTFDVGHANTVFQPCYYIEGKVKLIAHIHLHDNDGRFDYHAPLGTGTVNMFFLIKVLKREGYSESIVIERPVDEALFNDLKLLKHYLHEVTPGLVLPF